MEIRLTTPWNLTDPPDHDLHAVCSTPYGLVDLDVVLGVDSLWSALVKNDRIASGLKTREEGRLLIEQYLSRKAFIL